MRTRRSKESGSSKGKAGSRDRQATSSPDFPDSPLNSSVSSKDIASRSKSPSTASSCSEASTAPNEKDKSKKSSEGKGKKRNLDSESEDSKGVKKRKDQERADSPTESSTDSSSVCNENDENSNDGDVENNQDDLSSSASSSAPSPASVVEAETGVKISTTSASTAEDTTGEASESPSAIESPALPSSPAKPVPIHPIPQSAVPAQPGVVQPPHQGGVPLHPPPLAPVQKHSNSGQTVPAGLHTAADRPADTKGPLGGPPHAAAFHAVAPSQLPPGLRPHTPTSSSHSVVPMPGALTQAPPLISEAHMQKEIKKEPGLSIKKEPGTEEMDRDREKREERDRERDVRERDLRSQGILPHHLPPHLSQYPPHHPGLPPHSLPPGAALPPSSQVGSLPSRSLGARPTTSPPTLYQTPSSGSGHHVPPPPSLTSGLPSSQHPPMPHHLPPGMHVPPGGSIPPHHMPTVKQEPRADSPHHRPRTPDQRSRSPFGRRSPMDPRPPLLDSSGRPLPPLDSSYKPIPVDASGRPLPIDSRLSEEHMRSRSPHMPHSPTRPRSRSPIRARSRSRSRSRSPNADSDSEIDIPRGPSPEPRIVNEQCHKTKNAIFIKHIWRAYNTCSRCDFEFQPLPESKLAKKREDRLRKGAPSSSSSSSSSHHPPAATVPRPASSSGAPPRPSSVKEERRDDEHLRRRSEEGGDRVAVSSAHPASRPTPSPTFKKRPDTPPSNTTADAQITSSLMASQHSAGPYGERLTPRGLPPPGFPPSHDPTPALRQLSEYARPHVLGQDPSRSIPYSLGGPVPPGADPMAHYRLAAMYPPGSRERLELELQRDKQERDARERELRERELREMEIREIRKQELEMKPPGFDRLPPGANPLDPHLIEMQRRYAASVGPGGLPPGHIPGVYPPASLASDLLARERERIERLESIANAERISAERLHAERLAIANDPVLRLQMAGGGHPGGGAPHPSTHTHAHSHTHLHLHQAESAAAALLQAQAGIPPSGPPGIGHPPPPPPIPGADPLAAVAAAAAAGGAPAGPYLPPSHALPPGHPLLTAAREQELAYRELLSRPPYSTDPVLAHQATAALREQQAYREAVGRDIQAQQILSAQAAHHEALQRQIALERERQLGPHLPH